MPEIVRRSQWYGSTTDRRRFSRTPDPLGILGLALHWPGDPVQYRNNLTLEQLMATVRGFRDYHRRVRGWKDIGYNLLIDPKGRLWEGAGYRVAAHSAVPGTYPLGNWKWIGCQLITGSKEAPTPAAIETVRWLRGAMVSGELSRVLPEFPRLPNALALSSHRRMPGATTHCPGDAIDGGIDRGIFNIVTSRDRLRQFLPLEVDGDEGHKTITETERALKRYGTYSGLIEEDHGLPAHRGEILVKAEQSYLKKIGWYRGDIDGDFGPLSIRAEQGWLKSIRFYEFPIDEDRGPENIKGLQRALNARLMA